MTHTTSKVFADSSVFIEAFKGNQIEFLNTLANPNKCELYINPIVCSEVWYLFIALNGKASPLALKERRTIDGIISSIANLFTFYRQYTSLDCSTEIIEQSLVFMQKYNLLPNDAIILATCLWHKIFFLASHDTDFEIACQSEGIKLITPQNYLQVLPQI